MTDEAFSQAREAVAHGIRVASGSTTIRVVAVAVVSGLLLAPLGLEWLVLLDRQQNRAEAHQNIAQSWSGRQEIAGPVLLVPTEFPSSKSGQSSTGVLRILPQFWNATVGADHEFRARGIHRVPLLTADIRLDGSFEIPRVSASADRMNTIHWEKAVLGIQISDTRGIQGLDVFWNQNSAPLVLESGIGLDGVASGVHVPVPIGAEDKIIPFVADLRLRASERLRIVPLGDDSKIHMTGSWPHPKFDGRHLPDTSIVDPDGFEASWQIHALARGFPSQLLFRNFPSAESVLWTVSPMSAEDASAGFSLHDPMNPYRWVERSFKYGILIVVLTLTTVLCLELILGIRLHLVQYAVVGIGQVLFFLLLLALSEHLGFGLGYFLGATVLTVMIGAFVHAATRSVLAAGILTGTIAVLYAVLFLVLRQETYALLTGTLLLLVMLAAVMWATRKLDLAMPGQDRAFLGEPKG